MKPKIAIIILIILYLVSGFFFWYFFIHKKSAVNQPQIEVQRFESLTQEEKVIEAMNNMQRNSRPSAESQQQVLDAFNKMR